MTHDWLNATEDDRRALYVLTKQVVDGQFQGKWPTFYTEVFNRKFETGIGYEDNFRKGKISRINANAIARWLEKTQPSFRAQLIELLQPDAIVRWSDFLSTNGRVGGLRLIRPAEINIVGLAGRSRVPQEQVRIGEEFLLQLTSSIEGAAIGLQKSGGRWFHLPLSDDGGGLMVGTGTNIIPRSADAGLPIPLSEDGDRGIAHFAILITPGDAPSNDEMIFGEAVADEKLDRLATFLNGSCYPFELHTMTIKVQ